MRDSAWVAANIGSACAVQDDSALEDTRQVLEDSHSDLEGVLGAWIERNMTGDQARIFRRMEKLPQILLIL